MVLLGKKRGFIRVRDVALSPIEVRISSSKTRGSRLDIDKFRFNLLERWLIARRETRARRRKSVASIVSKVARCLSNEVAEFRRTTD